MIGYSSNFMDYIWNQIPEYLSPASETHCFIKNVRRAASVEYKKYGMTGNVPYLHMNWGWSSKYNNWDSRNNGWYHFNTATATENYQYNRKMILVNPNK